MYLKCDEFEEKKEVNIMSSADPNDWKTGGFFEGGTDIHNNFEINSMNPDSREEVYNYEGGWGGAAGGNDWNAGGYGAEVSAP